MKAKKEIEDKSSISDAAVQKMKEIAQSLGGVRQLGSNGINIGYEDFKKIEKCMVKLEDHLSSKEIKE